MKTLYTTRVHVSGGRDGRAATDDGRLDVGLSMPRELGGNGQGANPEQLFAAGFGACFNSSLRFAARGMKLDAGDVVVKPTVQLLAADDGAFHVGVRLEVAAPGLRHEDLDRVIAEAKRICAYSNATRGNVAVEVVA